MKRWWILVIVLMWISACDSNSSAITRIQESGVLRVAMDPSLAPFEFVDSAGNPAGFDVDLARQIGERLGVDVHFVTTGYDGLYDTLTVGNADIIISALYPDPNRTQSFAFSPPYLQAGEILVVRQDSTINGVVDLAGKQVIVVYGTQAHMLAQQWQRTLTPPPELLPGDAPETILGVLAAGYADAVLIDNISAQIHLRNISGLRIIGSPVEDAPYVIAARMKDRDLIENIGAILAEMHSDGTMDALLERWLVESYPQTRP
ncbi:MAG TPA: ABC transporter substrate-binding protein [Anaerolineae bacterium]|nr:ABC transporter substrate-binding protein [Anaerolineae bacterium]